MRIVVSEFMDEAALRGFDPAWEVVYDPSLVEDRDRCLATVAGADAIIVRNRTRVDASLLNAAPELRAVGRLGVGLDNIDMEACAARGVAVFPATGANALSVAEYVIATSLVLVRGAYLSTEAVRAGEWPRTHLVGGEVSGRNMGLLGYGGIARMVAERARALGMEIAAFDPHLPADDPCWSGVQRCEDAEALFETADVLSLHVPLTPETRRLVDRDAIARLPKGAVVINTARGGIVDEMALAEALRDGRLGGAALDVFETEPLDAAAGAVFEGLRNVILTPHVAGVTGEGNIRVSRMTVENVRKALEEGNG
ncbi:(S)-sulfolactate dehydrogenase [Palleronia aestuarii]|uniref:(S)-sulfolactate dehydrogenase n=1 Tax=Palleronia aestuarii TaxID=568105 RepID=A0A2W7N9T7_9RHOB|nr:hydroxyacid dehydrogenase [Palleronia aestuarii]PZX17001.1 (S)-sulfolactate dehydrogenase [Palleronia aestuarii]